MIVSVVLSLLYIFDVDKPLYEKHVFHTKVCIYKLRPCEYPYVLLEE